MAHKHREELIRWSNAKEGTGVWTIDEDLGCFSIGGCIDWNSIEVCIVDDEQAEIRKNLYKYPELTIEVLENGFWVDTKIHYLDVNVNKRYRFRRHQFKIADYVHYEFDSKDEYRIRNIFENGMVVIKHIDTRKVTLTDTTHLKFIRHADDYSTESDWMKEDCNIR